MRSSSTSSGRFAPIFTFITRLSSNRMDLNSPSGVGRSKGNFAFRGTTFLVLSHLLGVSPLGMRLGRRCYTLASDAKGHH